MNIIVFECTNDFVLKGFSVNIKNCSPNKFELQLLGLVKAVLESFNYLPTSTSQRAIKTVLTLL
jgi:hypothetical protein